MGSLQESSATVRDAPEHRDGWWAGGEVSWDPAIRGRTGTWPSILPYLQTMESLGRALTFLFRQPGHDLRIDPNLENTKMNTQKNPRPESTNNFGFSKIFFFTE